MIEELINPKTKEYRALKEHVLSSNFSWCVVKSTVINEDSSKYASSPYFSHAVVKAPGNPNLFPTRSSDYAEACNFVLKQIFKANDIKIKYITRINFNLTVPFSDKHTEPHYDHLFDHKNLLIYLSNSDGDTVVCDDEENVLESYSPKEDSIIMFEGKHYHFLPKKSLRIVLVCTFVI